MSDKAYMCPKCLTVVHHKGKCEVCKTILILVDVYLDRLEREAWDEKI